MKFYFLLIMPIFFSCEDAIELSKDEVTSINYRFKDSSVPPKYHRSYAIKITPDNLHVTVNSYGDVLADKEITITSADFDQLIETINTAKLVPFDLKSEPGCTGGTSERLDLFENNKKVYAASIDNCGGPEIPAKFGDLESVKSAIKKLIPNFSDLLK